MTRQKLLKTALSILRELGLPKEQQNERSALCLLALLDLQPGREWKQATSPLIGITPMMDWIRLHYRKAYAPNSRETVRRFTMHQFVTAGIAVYNPDKPDRPVNSPNAVYQVDEAALRLLREVGSANWKLLWEEYGVQRPTLVSNYAQARDAVRVAVKLGDGQALALTPGPHSELIREIVEVFGSIFVRDALLLYAGDTGDKWAYFDAEKLRALGVEVDAHGKMPDVVLLDQTRNWLVLVEAVTSHGPATASVTPSWASCLSTQQQGLSMSRPFPLALK